MTLERRAFNNYPESLRTRQNNRETFIADDPSYEPEQADFLNGFIGDVSVLTEEDLERTPQIKEDTDERQKYQLSIGTTYIDPVTQERVSVATYTDLVNQIEANDGEVTDPNRVFATEFYAWTPPIDYDKHINFSRYLWVGTGTGDVQGEYVTKEPTHSKTVIHQWDGTELTANDAEIENGLPAVGPEGTFVEDASTAERFVYRSDGVSWQLLDLQIVDDVPTDFSDAAVPSYYYVSRTGPDYQRPLVWKYTDDSGRWIPQSVVVRPDIPDTIRENMVWEDTRLGGERRFRIVINGTFQDLTYTSADGPPGSPGTDGEYIYDTREYADLTDEWAQDNWWRHYEDLSPVDRSERTGDDQAVRPILEFWQGIESVAGDTKDFRNENPLYKKYAIDGTSLEGIDTGESTTIFEYQRGTGQDDPVIGYPLSFNDSGEFLFDLTLELDDSAFIGYHYFLNTTTGLLHGVWHKSDELTNQEEDENGLYEVPVGITSNADHEILTTASRSRMITHMTGNMEEQDDFSGSSTGLNSYRWTDRDPAVGVNIIDAEETHLRTMATLQSAALDFPNAMRRMAKEYNKVLFRFTNRLTQLWNNQTITDGSGSLTMSAEEACDVVLTSLFIGRNEDFPYFYSDMGTFLETIAANGVPTVIKDEEQPIYIPPSPPRVGASKAFEPRSILLRDGTTALLGHERAQIASFEDERDLVWLELQQRFFDATPSIYKTESATFSARFNEAGFTLQDYYGNYTPDTPVEPVDEVVEDFTTIVSPSDGLRVHSKAQAVYAVYNAGRWVTTPAITDDIFLNNDDSEYYIYNGKGTFLIDRWERPFDFEYSTNEFRRIVRRDFERFLIFRQQDFSENTTFDADDPFTWNYRSAGVEGHYVGQYSRVYNTERPHSASWEVMGYSVEPSWWRTSYPPDSTASDGSPRYGSANSMWDDFAAGIVNTPSGPVQKDQFVMAGPTPVDSVGELLDPIAAGVVDIEKLDSERIDDVWIFGDGSPEEQDFLDSTFFSYSIALAGYLLKNGQWVDSLWVSNRVATGETGTYPIFNAPHVVNGDTLTRPDIASRPIHLEVVDGETQQNLGTHAWISENVQVEGGNVTEDFSRIVKNTSAALTWKTSGYINEDRTIVATLSRAEIPFSDVHVILHKSQPIEQNFCSGVLVVRERPSGYRVFGYDPFKPVFTVERPAVPVIGGQLFLEQEFIVTYTDSDDPNVTGGAVFSNEELQRTYVVTEFKLPSRVTLQDTAVFAVIINGQRFQDQYITVDNDNNSFTIDPNVELMEGDRLLAQVITTQTTSSTLTRQFIVKGVTFPYFATGTGEFQDIEYGRFFESYTEVINFMIGYGRYLVSQGWVFDSLSEAGATRDWLLGAKRFARWVLETDSIWNPDRQVDILDEDVFAYSPIQDFARFQSDYGQTTSVETIMNGAYGVLNRRAEPIDSSQTEVTRIDDSLEVRRLDTTNDETEMFGVRVNLIEAEHVVVFSNTTRFSDIIYDPVSGLAQRTLFVDSYRTLDWRGRLQAPGFILTSDRIVPNFEKQAFDITRFYDRYRTIDDPLRRESARNLYGYVPANQSRTVAANSTQQRTPNLERRQTSDSSQYMIPVGAADRTRFDYYRGMIQVKGTNRAIYAFTRGSSIGRDNFFINEDWAWKIGPDEFGDTRREIVQIDVGRLDFRDEVQVIQWSGPIDDTNNTIEVEDFDRNDPDGDPRWILPPSSCETEDTCNLEFPIDRDTGLIDVDAYQYFAKLFDTENNRTVLGHVHYDPEVDKFDSAATCLVDYFNAYDPARYNTGPDAAFSNDRCWRDTQVGCTWWNPERKAYIDYRGLLPEYEDAAKFWGELLFYKATIERPGTLIQGQTQDDFESFDGGEAIPGYAVADTITMSDGSIITVDAVSGGVVTEFTVTTSGTTTVRNNETLTQSTTSGVGFGFELVVTTENTENPGDETVITTYDYLDITRTTPVAHGVPIGDVVTISIRKADQDEYNLENVEVTADTTTSLVFEIETNPDTPATGDPEAVFGHIDIYEWVESPVLPSEWEEYVEGLNDPTHPNGTPLNVDNDPSYVELTVRDARNQEQTVYYFWVLNSSGNNGKGKPLTSEQISSRIGDPTANQVPWFAPVDEGNMVIFTDGEKVLDEYALEVIIDARHLQTHNAFVLFSQNSLFYRTPPEIVEKMADSLSGIDGKGNEVPSPLLAEAERYGSCFFPIQTVFRDREGAVDVYVEAVNRIFKGKNLSEVDILTGIFKLEDEQSDTNPDGFWKRTAYVERRIGDREVYETVQTIDERDRRADLDLYAPTDIVRVLESGETDPWTDEEVASNYEWTGSEFLQVGIDNNTVEINNNIDNDPERFRGSPNQVEGALFFLIYAVMDTAEQNDLIYSLVHEMKVQNPDPECDWAFKTSYITTQIFVPTDKSPFVRPDEARAIRDNILAVKPYRTKFRGEVNTVTVDEIEPFDTNIIEFPDVKITLCMDRLSCNLIDECGWDGFAWDTRDIPCSSWDFPTYDFEDLGRGEEYLLATLQGDGETTKYEVDAIFDPTLYDIRTVVKQNGEEVDADYVTVTKSHTQVFVDTQFALPSTFTVEVYQNQGFYKDTEPSFDGTSLEDTLFEPAPSSYEHAIVRSDVPPTEFRTVVGGDGNVIGTTTGPWIELYQNGTLLEQGVDYTYNFDYENDQYDAIFVVAPTAGDEIAFGFMRGCYDINDELGGRPEERIVSEVCDSVNICVINDWTQAYTGWDTTPWDVAAWDQAPTNVGRRVFLIGIGKQEEIPAGTEFFNTSEDINVTDNTAIVGTSPQSYDIVQVDLQKGGAGAYTAMTEGVEYDFIGTLNNVIATNVPEQEDFVADGVNFVYQTTAGTEIQYVFLDGALKTEGVDYTLDVTRTEITWTQPAPVISPNNATVIGEDFEGDGIETDYETGHNADSLNVDNIFVFQNRSIVDTADYSVNVGGADLRFDTAPAIGDEIILYSVGNIHSDNTIAYTRETFVAAAAQTIFNTSSGGFAADDTVWVFIDGTYQVLGTDYTVTGADQITLTAPLAGGETVETRVLSKGTYDNDHIVFSASGTASDVIPGLSDANEIEKMLIFVDGVVQNGWTGVNLQGPDYTITDTNPDTINWTERSENTDLNWTGVDGSTLPTGAVPAAYFDISTITTTFRLWFDDGSTTAPAAGGTTLVAVAFGPGDSDQDISDAVTAALIGADAEFANATNGGGSFRIVNVEVVSTGEVPDAVDGAVATGVTIDIKVQGNGTPTGGQDITVRFIRTIQMSTTTVIDVNPDAGQTVSAQFLPYIENGDVVRYRFNGWFVGPLGGYTVDDLVSPLDTFEYDIVNGVFTFDSLPTENQFFSITYTEARPNGFPESILVRMDYAREILDDHESYDDPNGLEEDAGSRPVGTRIINTTTNLTYTWNGTDWDTDPVPVVGQRYYVTAPQQIWEWNGTAWNKLFDVGDAFTKPPLLDYPAFGEGIRYGTYALGSSADAATEYEDAYEVMQHPGDCPP